MIRLFIPHDLAAGAELALDHGQSHYLASVMRQGVGDEVALFNGRDGEWRSVITAVTKRAVAVRAADLLRPQQAGPDLELIVALVKRGRLETIVEKAAELGARRVRLVQTERTNADRARVERLTAIAAEAAEQTGRLDVPAGGEPVNSQADRRLEASAPACCSATGRARHDVRSSTSLKGEDPPVPGRS